MKYYFFPASNNCRKVTATIDHLGIEVERIVVNPLEGAQRKPEFLAINPNGKIPALTDGDLELWESHAIMAYVASQKDNTLWPKDARRYDIMRWFNWQAAHFGPAVGGVVFERVFKKLAGMGPPDEGKVKSYLEDVEKFGAVLDAHLKGRTFLVGDDLTLADFSVGSTLTHAAAAEVPLEKFREIQRWSTTLDEIPAWRDSKPQM